MKLPTKWLASHKPRYLKAEGELLRNAEFLSDADLKSLPFAEIGERVLVHQTVVLVGVENMRLGSDIRIDPYSVLTAAETLFIGSHVHIAAHVLLAGGAGITLSDFSGISHGARVLSASDDFRAGALTGPTVPLDLRNVQSARVTVGRHAVVGANAVLLPGTQIGDGAMVGALSMVRSTLDPWGIYAGVPVHKVGERDREGTLLAEKRFARRGG